MVGSFTNKTNKQTYTRFLLLFQTNKQQEIFVPFHFGWVEMVLNGANIDTPIQDGILSDTLMS